MISLARLGQTPAPPVQPAPPTQPAMPSYKAAAAMLEAEKGAGLRLFGWTIARAVLIGAPFVMAGVPIKKAIAGSILASSIISGIAVAAIRSRANGQ